MEDSKTFSLLEYRPNPKPMLSLMFSLSSFSSQNITEKQITSQKSSSSIDCRHFDFDLGGKKIPSGSLFCRLIRYRRFKNRFNRVCRFFTSGSSFQATETILATGTTIWKPGCRFTLGGTKRYKWQ